MSPLAGNDASVKLGSVPFVNTILSFIIKLWAAALAVVNNPVTPVANVNVWASPPDSFRLSSSNCTVTVTPAVLLFDTSNSIKIDFKPFGVVYTAVGDVLSADKFLTTAL